MTCIVGLIEKGKVYVGADSCGSNGYDKHIRKDEKVFQNDKFIIGCTSSFRMIQLLRYSFTPPKIKEGQEIYEYMCTDFINSIRQCFKEGGYLQQYEDGDEKGGVFLVGYKGRLFCVEQDFQVGEYDMNYISIGSGSPFAMGSMHSTQASKNLTPKNRIINALKAAECFNAFVCPPFKVLTT